MSGEISGAPAVRANSLGRRFGRHWVLSHLDFEVARGDVVWLRGANGAGKTTLIRLIAGLMPSSHGELEVLGRSMPSGRSIVSSKTSVVSHALYLYSELTALETLRLWSTLCGRSDREENLLELLEEVGLADAMDRPVSGFSAGMRKRLAFARVRLEAPELLLLDEPFSSLDIAGCELVEAWLRSFVKGGGTVVMASHQEDRARLVCSRELALVEGQLVSGGAR